MKIKILLGLTALVAAALFAVTPEAEANPNPLLTYKDLLNGDCDVAQDGADQYCTAIGYTGGTVSNCDDSNPKPDLFLMTGGDIQISYLEMACY
jgi:hypothetical protein